MSGEFARVVDMRRVRVDSGPQERMGDEALAAAAATGDPDSVGRFFDRFEPGLTRFVGRVLRGAPDVEDVVQITFLRVAEGRCRYDGRSKATTWLFGIAHNVIRERRRSSRRFAAFSDVLADVGERYFGRTPDLDIAVREEMVSVEQAFDALSYDYRAAFVLCVIEEMSAPDAARVLGTTQSAVWKRVSVARKALREAARKEER